MANGQGVQDLSDRIGQLRKLGLNGNWKLGALTILLPAVLLAGCAWRSASAEHYLGPVFFRYRDAGAAGPEISQIVAVGVLGEAGRQWGLSIGVIERTVVSPLDKTETPTATRNPGRYSLFTGVTRPGHWGLSPLYYRVQTARPPGLVVRRLHGLQLGAGPEVRGVSLGMVSLARLDAPDNAIAVVRYDARAPMNARFSLWRPRLDDELPLTEILEEVGP
jgi:hypothetical protein